MTDRFVTVPDSLELPEDVKVPSARLSDSTAAGRALLADADAAAQRTSLGLGTAATTAATDYATAAQGAKADATEVEQVALTAPLAYTLPAGTPADVVHSVVFTQDGTGGHTVTYDDQPVSVDLAAGASTTVELHPVGAGYVVRYPPAFALGSAAAHAHTDYDAAGTAAGLVAYARAAPRLTYSHVARRNGIKNGWETQANEDYVTFSAFNHCYDVAYKNTGPVYALARPLGGGTIQGVWRSLNGGETWAKLFDLTIAQASGVWYEAIFVEPSAETIYVQKTTTGYATPLHNYVESYTNAGVLLGSKDVGDSHWISGNHGIDACPDPGFTKRYVIFGEYASDAKATVNLWRTDDRGVNWTAVKSWTGNNGVMYSGEVRHVHAVAADPYTKHWWVATGDGDSQCHIYRSTDSGTTWTLLFSGTQRERATSFVFTSTHVYYGMDSAQPTLTHSKIVRITKADLTRTDVATVKDGFPVWMLTKTFAPSGFLVWPACEYSSNTPQDYVTVQFYDFDSNELVDVARFSIAAYSTGTEGFREASRYQDVGSGSILFMPTANVQKRGGYVDALISTFSRARLTLPTN